MEPGEYAVRGGIFDIYPAGETDPVRLDMFGDTIERISIVEPLTGEVLEEPEAASIFPATHYVSLPEKIEEALKDADAGA